MAEDELKVQIELRIVGDGRVYLNFWNWRSGDDVVAKVKEGHLFMDINKVETEVSLQRFIDDIKSKF